MIVNNNNNYQFNSINLINKMNNVDFDKLFEISNNCKLITVKENVSIKDGYNICCKTEMLPIIDGLQCLLCKKIKFLENEHDEKGTNQNCIINFSNSNYFHFGTIETSYEDKVNKIYDKMCHILNHTEYHINRSILRESAKLVKIIIDGTKKVKKDNRASLFGAAVYYTSKHMNEIYDKIEISKAFKLNKRGIASGDKILKKLWIYNKLQINIDKDPIPLYVQKYCNLLKCDKYTNDTINIVNLLIKLNISQKAQIKSICAGATYYYIYLQNFIIDNQSNLDSNEVNDKILVTKSDFEIICNVGKTTFMDIYKDILYFQYLLPEDYQIDKYIKNLNQNNSDYINNSMKILINDYNKFMKKIIFHYNKKYNKKLSTSIKI